MNSKLVVIICILLLFSSSFAEKKQAKRSISFGGGKYQKMPLGRSKQKPIPFKFSTSASIEIKEEKKLGLEIGIKAGSSAGLTGAMGEVYYSLNPIISGAYIRGGFGYLTGDQPQQQSSNRIKIATANLDALYSLATIKTFDNPLNIYIGGGLIYPLKVNITQASGLWGAKAYLGSRYEIQKDASLYGEIAYTGIKYSPIESALRGVEAMLGYSYSF